MFLFLDDEKINKLVTMALQNVGAYGPGESITDVDMQAGQERLFQMFTDAFLIDELTFRLRGIYGYGNSSPDTANIRLECLRLAMSTGDKFTYEQLNQYVDFVLGVKHDH